MVKAILLYCSVCKTIFGTSSSGCGSRGPSRRAAGCVVQMLLGMVALPPDTSQAQRLSKELCHHSKETVAWGRIHLSNIRERFPRGP